MCDDLAARAHGDEVNLLIAEVRRECEVMILYLNELHRDETEWGDMASEADSLGLLDEEEDDMGSV